MMSKNDKEFFDEPEEVKEEETMSKGKRLWNWCKENKWAILCGIGGGIIGATGMKVVKDNEINHVKREAEEFTETAITIGHLTGALEAYQEFAKDSSNTDEK